MSSTPQLPETRAICPRCDAPILERELKPTKMQMMSVDGEPGEVMEHVPAGGCGKWLWRRKKGRA